MHFEKMLRALMNSAVDVSLTKRKKKSQIFRVQRILMGSRRFENLELQIFVSLLIRYYLKK